MSISNLFAVVVPALVMAFLAFAIFLYRKVQYPSPLVWGSMVNGLGPVRAHHVLDYNQEIDTEEPFCRAVGTTGAPAAV